MINMKLAREHNLSKSAIQQIEKCYDVRYDLSWDWERGHISDEEYQEMWTKNEYDLQALWGFPLDSKYHKFWEMHGCTCPKMDNEDAYPTGYYTRDGSCPLHGEHTWQK